MYNLLQEPVIPVEGSDSASLSLPGVLAALTSGRELTFPGLAAHQRQAWFCFLVQLATLALSAADRADPPDTEQKWRSLLSALAGAEADTAYALVVPDVARPALLQPPVRDAEAWAKFRDPILEPDSIDILINAKNHEVKLERASRPAPHLWLYALVTLQTMQGFLGRGNYGIARMNGGFSSRPFVDRMAGPGWAARFRRDLNMLMAERANILKNYEAYYQVHGGLGLVWLEPWDTEVPIELTRLDPYFIEICRRVRLVEAGNYIGALLRPSESPRVDAAAAKGLLGDPWAPINAKAATAYTIPANGFDYRLVVEIVTDRNALPPSLRAANGDPDHDLDLQFNVLVRGQGRTDGLHERIVPVSRSLADRFDDPAMNERLRALAAQMLHDVGKVADPALRTALRAYVQGAPDSIDFTDERVHAHRAAFDRDIDGGFLSWLWQRAEATDDETTQIEWQRWLKDTAERRLYEGLASLPTPSNRRERARVAAERVFHGMLRKGLPLAYHPKSPATKESLA